MRDTNPVGSSAIVAHPPQCCARCGFTNAYLGYNKVVLVVNEKAFINPLEPCGLLSDCVWLKEESHIHLGWLEGE